MSALEAIQDAPLDRGSCAFIPLIVAVADRLFGEEIAGKRFMQSA
ncbi:hypothetical protein [Sphingobium sp.]|nr:hypothetical protein [Sphingobium sp.]